MHKTTLPTVSRDRTPVIAVTRRQNGNRPARVYPQVFDYENNAEARRLRDEGIAELQEKQKKTLEDRRVAMEGRRKALMEKNRIAAENERLRNEEKERSKARSKTAIANLVESRKRNR